jgi:hypothetical protein
VINWSSEEFCTVFICILSYRVTVCQSLIIRKTRRPVRALLVKRINELEAELPSDTPDKAVVQVTVDMLEKVFVKLDNVDHQVISLISDSMDDTEQDTELSNISDYEKRCRFMKLKCDNFWKMIRSQSGHQSQALLQTHTRLLPLIVRTSCQKSKLKSSVEN